LFDPADPGICSFFPPFHELTNMHRRFSAVFPQSFFFFPSFKHKLTVFLGVVLVPQMVSHRGPCRPLRVGKNTLVFLSRWARYPMQPLSLRYCTFGFPPPSPGVGLLLYLINLLTFPSPTPYLLSIPRFTFSTTR